MYDSYICINDCLYEYLPAKMASKVWLGCVGCIAKKSDLSGQTCSSLAVAANEKVEMG